MNTAELNRQLENLIRIGTIAVVEHDAHRLKVRSGKLLSNWLDWPAEIGRNYKRWRPLRLGTQVIISCPAGDPAQAMIIGMLYSNDLPPPNTDPDTDLIEFNDGTQIQYLSSASRLEIRAVGDVAINVNGYAQLVSDGPILIKSDTQVKVKGPYRTEIF